MCAPEAPSRHSVGHGTSPGGNAERGNRQASSRCGRNGDEAIEAHVAGLVHLAQPTGADQRKDFIGSELKISLSDWVGNG